MVADQGDIKLLTIIEMDSLLQPIGSCEKSHKHNSVNVSNWYWEMIGNLKKKHMNSE
jgi:hypothetical protein